MDDNFLEKAIRFDAEHKLPGNALAALEELLRRVATDARAEQISTLDIPEAQRKAGSYFREIFGRTPLRQRLDDIRKEADELANWSHLDDLKTEFGDILASVLAGIDECGLRADLLLEENENKIRAREKQYKALGRKVQVAIFGGAFDPITNAHIEVGKFVLAAGQVDEIWYTPCFKHMYNKNMASAEHRMAMIHKATKDDPRLKLFPFEIDHQLAGETYHFAKLLLADKLSETHSFSFIIGMDNANSFHRWVNYQDLERLVRFIVVPRAGETQDPNVTWYLNGRHLLLKPTHGICLPQGSSTQVRQSIKEGSSTWDLGNEYWSKLVNPWVADYIRSQNLYKS